MSAGLTHLIRSLALMTLIKNLERHSDGGGGVSPWWLWTSPGRRALPVGQRFCRTVVAAAADAAPPDPVSPGLDLVGVRRGLAIVWWSVAGSPAAATGAEDGGDLDLRGRCWRGGGVGLVLLLAGVDDEGRRFRGQMRAGALVRRDSGGSGGGGLHGAWHVSRLPWEALCEGRLKSWLFLAMVARRWCRRTCARGRRGRR
jgi:hypothetical protein